MIDARPGALASQAAVSFRPFIQHVAAARFVLRLHLVRTGHHPVHETDDRGERETRHVTVPASFWSGGQVPAT